jgi:hypothetical protein
MLEQGRLSLAIDNSPVNAGQVKAAGGSRPTDDP